MLAIPLQEMIAGTEQTIGAGQHGPSGRQHCRECRTPECVPHAFGEFVPALFGRTAGRRGRWPPSPASVKRRALFVTMPKCCVRPSQLRIGAVTTVPGNRKLGGTLRIAIPREERSGMDWGTAYKSSAALHSCHICRCHISPGAIHFPTGRRAPDDSDRGRRTTRRYPRKNSSRSGNRRLARPGRTTQH